MKANIPEKALEFLTDRLKPDIIEALVENGSNEKRLQYWIPDGRPVEFSMQIDSYNGDITIQFEGGWLSFTADSSRFVCREGLHPYFHYSTLAALLESSAPIGIFDSNYLRRLKVYAIDIAIERLYYTRSLCSKNT
jgi:hypothetical protein